MAGKESPGTEGQSGRGMGFSDLSMNEVPASVTAEQSEAPRHAGRLVVAIVVIVVAAAVAALGVSVVRNLAPGQEAEDRLRDRLREHVVWQRGIVEQVGYVSGSKLRAELSSQLRVTRDEDREAVRKAMRDLIMVLHEERPGRDLVVEGYQADSRIAHAEFRHRSTLIGPGGEHVPDITVRVEGDHEGGMGEAMGRSRPAPGR